MGYGIYCSDYRRMEHRQMDQDIRNQEITIG